MVRRMFSKSAMLQRREMVHRRVAGGFTLIELLVVISIISVLIAMLLPALGTARHAARMAACLSGIRQITVAGNNYCYDYRGYFPSNRWRNRLNSAGSYQAEIHSYLNLSFDAPVGEASALSCPTQVQHLYPQVWQPTYSINQMILGVWNDSSGWWVPAWLVVQKIDRVSRPSEAYYFMDGAFERLEEGRDVFRHVASNSLSHDHQFPHLGNASIGYVDGHAAAVAEEAFLSNMNINSSAWRGGVID